MVASTSSGLKVAARLSPPLSISRSSSPGNSFSRRCTASRFTDASSRIAVCGHPPVSTPSTRGEDALSLDLTEGDQAQSGADQQGRRRIEVGRRRPLTVGARAAQRGAEGDGVMTGRQAVLDGAEEAGEEPIVAEGGGGAERLASHLAARGPELGDALRRVEPRVERNDGREIARDGHSRRVRRRHGVARSRAPLEMGDDERLEARRVADAPVLYVRFEAERMGEAAGGEEAVGELEERQECGINGHGGGCFPTGPKTP